MYLVIGDFRTHPGHRESFLEAIRALAESMRASEPGLVQFRLIQDKHDAGRFLVLETFEDESAGQFHRDQPHSKAFVEHEKASGWGPPPVLLFEGPVNFTVG